MAFASIEMPYGDPRKDRMMLHDANFLAEFNAYNHAVRQSPQVYAHCRDALIVLYRRVRGAENSGLFEKGATFMGGSPRAFGVQFGDFERNLFAKLNAAISYQAANNGVELP